MAYVWGAGVEVPGYYTYLSDVLDHTPEFTIACLEDLLRRVFTGAVTHLALWADIGTHFRAARMWGYWLDTLPVKMKVDTSANYFPDGHGKEKLDGHVGRTGRWKDEAARRKVISTHAELQEVLQARADKHNKEHLGRSQCHYFVFSPPPVASLPGKRMSPQRMLDAGCGVKSTFCVRAVRTRSGHVMLHNHKLTGMAAVATTAPLYPEKGGPVPAVELLDIGSDEDAAVARKNCGADRVEQVGEVGADGWRRTYRKHKPEKNPPAWKYMRQCFQSIHKDCTVLAGRRQPLQERVQSKLASVEAAKARRKNAKLRLSGKGGGGAGASSSSSSSSQTGSSSSSSGSDNG